MSKSEKSSEKSAPELPISSSSYPLYSFYRPHKRVGEDGLLFNNLTGEFERPPSMTKQEFKEESDINNIVRMFKPHEMVAMIQQNALLGTYEELPDEIDYQQAIHLVREAEEAFMTLPSKVRDRFGQDTEQFLAFASNPANGEALKEMGLVNLPQVQAQAHAEPAPSSAHPKESPAVSKPNAGSEGGRQGGS